MFFKGDLRELIDNFFTSKLQHKIKLPSKGFKQCRRIVFQPLG